ncbi:MAG TPA: hypothetical protein VIJ28_15330, partial [Chloroflexota bacterium]
QEFLANVADGIITVYAADSSLARANQAADSREAANHSLTARLAVWRLLPRALAAIDRILLATLSGQELKDELARLRAYAPGYLVDGTALGRELAALVAARNGYPFSLAR